MCPEQGEAGKMAIVVSHGSLARGLVSAMEKVLGPQPNVFWISNTGKTPAAVEAEIEVVAARAGGGREVYLLTDLRGGSCATSCLRASRTRGVSAVLYGTNLTLLLEFVLKQSLPRKEFFEALLAKARSSVDGVLFENGPPASPGGGDAPAASEGSGRRDRGEVTEPVLPA